MERKEVWTLGNRTIELKENNNVIEKGFNINVNDSVVYQLIDKDNFTSGNESIYNIFIASILGDRKDRVELDGICINLLTIARNCYNKDTKMNDWLNLVDDHLDKYKTILIEYANNSLSRKTVIFYLPNYKGIPELYRRPMTDGRQVYMDVYKEMYKYLKPELYHFYNDNNLDMYTFRCLDYPLPHRQLVRALKNKVRSTQSLGMLTHYLMDLHIGKYYPDTTLIESYTGKLIPKKQFGIKAFDVEYIPFNIATHIAFGDKQQLRPYVKNKNKKELMEVARKNIWHMRSEQEILKDITHTTLSPNKVFTNIKV